MSKRPDCYKCIHRREIPGDAHTRCDHPEIQAGAFAASDKLGIKGHKAGIQGGWFLWPANFDPTWLEKCTGFEAKTAKAET